MKRKGTEKILFTKGDIATMLSTSMGIFRIASQSLEINEIDWKNKNQKFSDQEVFWILKKLRKRLTDEEIDVLIRENARN